MSFCTKLINTNVNRKLFKENCKKVLASYRKSQFNLNICCTRLLSSNVANSRPIISRENFISFETMVEQRHSEARRSIVVEIHKEGSVSQLQSICSTFGNIKSMAEFEPKSNKRMVIVEFEEEASVNEVVHRAQIRSNGHDFGSIQIPFLKLSNFRLCSEKSDLDTRIPFLTAQNSSHYKDQIEFMITKCNNLSEQIQHYYETQAMTEVGWRLRFLTCRKIEWVLPGVLSHVRIIPFGSSVNTFGNNSCDLDMVIDTSRSYDTPIDESFPFEVQSSASTNHYGNPKRNLEVFSDLISFYMPGFSNIVRILQARVPIVKCNEVFTGLECDITVGNKSGYFMSELLYLYGCSDPRVRPLVFCIRLWAKEKQLTRKSQPGMWFSNFTTTIMVLFFLMNDSAGAVIPPLEVLEKLADRSFVCEGIKYSYARDVAKFPETSNSDSLEQLLENFYNFYANFNYKNGISIVTGKTFTKPINNALYIQNPVERNLNVSRNVNLEQLEAFKEECKFALYALGQNKEKSKYNLWGLPTIVGMERTPPLINKSQNFDLKDIFYPPFSMDEEQPQEKRKVEASKQKSQNRKLLAKNLNMPLTDSVRSPSQAGKTLNLVNVKKRKKIDPKKNPHLVPNFRF